MSAIQIGKSENSEKISLRTFYAKTLVTNNPNTFHDFVQVGFWNGDYEYLNLDELKQLRRFINEAIIKITFKKE